MDTQDQAFTVAEYVEKAAQTALLAWGAGMELLKVPTTNEELFDPSIMDIIDEI
ncbi:MAG: hypothetical protein IIY92_06910 [Lachnospiraceae bacterium]|nr:hypothetical protein [Lachnospiraceae bacterium]